MIISQPTLLISIHNYSLNMTSYTGLYLRGSVILSLVSLALSTNLSVNKMEENQIMLIMPRASLSMNTTKLVFFHSFKAQAWDTAQLRKVDTA
jgi:hypothetical protein